MSSIFGAVVVSNFLGRKMFQLGKKKTEKNRLIKMIYTRAAPLRRYIIHDIIIYNMRSVQFIIKSVTIIILYSRRTFQLLPNLNSVE